MPKRSTGCRARRRIGPEADAPTLPGQFAQLPEIQRRRIGPVIRELEREVDRLFAQAGIRFD
jgi:hypothetical protein